MKKLTILCVVAALMTVPFSVSAMDVITDSEMGEVTAEGGITIFVWDVNFHLDIMNIAWGDTDCGTLILSTMRHQYSPGYVNINNIQIDNIYITADTDNDGTATDSAGGQYISVPHNCLSIDVMTFSSNGAHAPYQAVRGKTGVVLQPGDGCISVEEVSIDGIYLDDHAYTPTTVEFTSMQKWNYTTGPLDDSKNLGSITIAGIQFTSHAYVGGYESANLVPGGELRPLNPNHRSHIIISSH